MSLVLPQDPRFWDPATTFPTWGVQDKFTGEIVPFNLWPHQMLDRAAIVRAYRERKWIAKVKPRRVGGSALFTTVVTQHVAFRRDMLGAIISYNRPNTQNLAAMCRRAYNTIPAEIRPRLNPKVTVGLDFPGIGSKLDIHTAKGADSARGDTLGVALADEVSSWPGAGATDTWVALRSAVSKYTGLLLVLSTPKFNGDPLHKVCLEAEEPGSKWIKLFTPWTQIQEYAIQPPPGWNPSARVVAYRELFPLTDAQAYWMDTVGLPDCALNVGKFRAEYPITEQDAWQLRSDSIFDATVLMRRLEELGLLGAPSEDVEALEFSPAIDGHRYIITCDPAGSWSRRDYFGIVVLDLDTLEPAYEVRCHGEASVIALLLARLSNQYNGAGIYVEANGVGEAVLSHLVSVMRHPRVWWRDADTGSPKPGWWSSNATRAIAIGALQTLIADGSLKLKSVRAITQLLQYDGGWGSARDEQRGHFDLVPAYAIAAWAWQREVGYTQKRPELTAKEESQRALQRYLRIFQGDTGTGRMTIYGPHR